MKTSRTIATLVVAVALSTTVLLTRLRAKSLASSGLSPAAQARQTVAGCVPRDNPDVRVFALDVMRCLIGDQQGQTLPEWERMWSSKCELRIMCGAGGGTHPTVSNGINKAAHRLPVSPDQLLQLQLIRRSGSPIQLMRGDESDKLGLPDFTSVLFNTVASNAIKMPALLGGLRTGTTTTLPPGSIIAKAIWGIVPLEEGGKLPTTPGSFYASTMTNEWESKLSDLSLPTPESVTQKMPTVSVNGWERFPFDARLTFNCDNSEATPFTTSCMHTFIVPSPDHVAALQLEDNGTDDAFTSHCGVFGCRVILVGIHFMVRVAPDAAVRRSDTSSLKLTSPWVFFTFWWTGRDNGTALPPPWKYYQMRVTQDFRDDSNPLALSSGIDRHITYNPYLEGEELGGAHSNCVSCHQFAAYNASAPSRPITCGVPLGLADIPALSLAQHPASPNSDCPSSADYFRSGNVGTDFVWSFAGLQPPPQPAASGGLSKR